MRSSKLIWRQIPVAPNTEYKIVLLIALGWTLIDMLYIFFMQVTGFAGISPADDLFNDNNFKRCITPDSGGFLYQCRICFSFFSSAHGNSIELPLGNKFSA